MERLKKKRRYPVPYFGHDAIAHVYEWQHGWYFRDHLDDRRGPYATMEEARAACRDNWDEMLNEYGE